MVTDRRGALTGAGTIYVSLYVYLRDVAVSYVTEREITLPIYQEHRKTYTRLQKKRKRKKKKSLSIVTPVVLLLLL